MTDEEIKAAQANIEYDKYEEIYRTQNQIKFETAEFKDIFKVLAILSIKISFLSHETSISIKSFFFIISFSTPDARCPKNHCTFS